MNGRVRAVFRKELREFRRNKLVVGTMAAVPFIFVALPLATVLSLKADTPQTAMKSAVGGAGLGLFLIPLFLPTIIAGYGVVGEREQGTLEPVLTTPVRREELLIGKALAAIVPTVVVAYVLFAAFATIVRLAAVSQVVALVWHLPEALAIVLFTPLLATFSIWVGLAISARSSDVRVAQQLSALAVLPLVGLISLFSFRVVTPTVKVAILVAALLVVLDAGAWRIVSALFDRERLLTRYGPS